MFVNFIVFVILKTNLIKIVELNQTMKFKNNFEFFVLILTENTNVEENMQNETSDNQTPNTNPNPNLNTDTSPNTEGEQDQNSEILARLGALRCLSSLFRRGSI